MKKRRKSKELQESEDDLIFYLEYYNSFDSRFKKWVVDKEIRDLEDKIKNDV